MTLDINIKDSEKEQAQSPIIVSDEKIHENEPPKVGKEKKVKIRDPQKSKKTKRIIWIAIAVLVLTGIGFLAYKGYTYAQNIGLKLSAGDIIPTAEEPELQKDSTGTYTNLLIVGIDTRENTALLNTDTIILVSYNYNTNEVVMLSIPRDFHVEINDTNWFARINSVYNNTENLEEGSGLEELKETVEEITNQEIQYHAMVDFSAFTEIVDAVGGITVDVENSFTDYLYPLGLGYQTVSFEAGLQEMDGETALQYARSRHSADNNEGTDFARAKRQQNVIVALKDKIMSTETFTNPKTLINIIASVADNITVSEFTIDDIQAGLNLGQSFSENEEKSYSFVLDPYIGARQLVEVKTMESGAYAIGPVLGLGDYTNIHDYMQRMYTDPQLYSENPTIRVYNTGLGYQETYLKTLELEEEFPYLDFTFMGTLFYDKEGYAVYMHENTNKTRTVEVISEYLEIETTEQPDYITTNLNGEDVTILLGKEILEETESEI